MFQQPSTPSLGTISGRCRSASPSLPSRDCRSIFGNLRRSSPNPVRCPPHFLPLSISPCRDGGLWLTVERASASRHMSCRNVRVDTACKSFT
jgi:hypothetical protein